MPYGRPRKGVISLTYCFEAYSDDSMADSSESLSSVYGSMTAVNRGQSPADTTHLLRGSAGSAHSPRQYGESGYEELFKDSVPCPSCRGLGRVPKEQESQLVALIPMKDKRLKPRRTVFYVLGATGVCVLIMALCFFFLFPRNITVTSNRPLLEPLRLDLNATAHFVNFTVMNFYNFTNNNFYQITITGVQMTAMYDEKLLVTATNKTHMDVPLKSMKTYGVSANLVLSKANEFGFLVSFCEDSRPWVHNLPFTFEMTANYTYLNHFEQATLKTFQQVSCYNKTMSAAAATLTKRNLDSSQISILPLRHELPSSLPVKPGQ